MFNDAIEFPSLRSERPERIMRSANGLPLAPQMPDGRAVVVAVHRAVFKKSNLRVADLQAVFNGFAYASGAREGSDGHKENRKRK